MGGWHDSWHQEERIMIDHFELRTEYPKVKEHGGGRLGIEKDGMAYFDTGKATKILSRSRIDFAGGDGIMLSGIELAPGGRYILQQWWLRYIRPSTDGGGA